MIRRNGCPQHAILDAAIGARGQLGLRTAVDLAEIADVQVPPRRDCCRAMQWRRAQAPAYADCRGSVRTAYLITTALVHGRVGITEVADIDNAQVLTIAAQMEGIGAGQETDGIMIRLLDGRTATVRMGSPLGSPENRLSIGQLEMKFVDCARNAVRPLPDDAVRAAADNILHLEDVQDVGELLQPFV
jgi:2-methylcitrate dehydratase PrpD